MYVYIIAVIRCDTKNIVTTLKLVFKVDLIIIFFSRMLKEILVLQL